MVVVIEKNANGKIEFTKEELEELLEKARQEGIKEGQKYSYIYTTPSNPLPNNPMPTWQPTITCEAPKSVPLNSTGTVGNIDLSKAINGI